MDEQDILLVIDLQLQPSHGLILYIILLAYSTSQTLLEQPKLRLTSLSLARHLSCPCLRLTHRIRGGHDQSLPLPSPLELLDAAKPSSMYFSSSRDIQLVLSPSPAGASGKAGFSSFLSFCFFFCFFIVGTAVFFAAFLFLFPSCSWVNALSAGMYHDPMPVPNPQPIARPTPHPPPAPRPSTPRGAPPNPQPIPKPHPAPNPVNAVQTRQQMT
mmetsp:Transcript_14683/g.37150  ORF Transcript_14683/g.37150 Transcript_14683/m.37150 type:complete len:214 (-) Transcript_14683:64-705(-)